MPALLARKNTGLNMPKKSKLASIPDDIKQWLNSALVAKNFGDYDAITAELQAMGIAIGRSSVHRFGSKLERNLAAVRASTQAAMAIVEHAPDASDNRSEAALSLIQTGFLTAMETLNDGAEEADPEKRLELLSKAARGIADISRASIGQKKFSAQVRKEIEAQTLASVSKTLQTNADELGLSDAMVDKITRTFLGMPNAA